jgi:hypothetical protein
MDTNTFAAKIPQVPRLLARQAQRAKGSPGPEGPRDRRPPGPDSFSHLTTRARSILTANSRRPYPLRTRPTICALAPNSKAIADWKHRVSLIRAPDSVWLCSCRLLASHNPLAFAAITFFHHYHSLGCRHPSIIHKRRKTRTGASSVTIGKLAAPGAR